MKKLMLIIAFMPLSLFTAPVEFWSCKFEDGYSMDDLNSWVVKWNKVLDGFEVLMKVVNSVNFFSTLEDCFTGEDITPDDFRLPFGITNVRQKCINHINRGALHD